MKVEKTGSDVTQRPNLDEQETSDAIHKDNSEPAVFALNATYTRTVEFEEHLVPFAQNVSYYTSLSSKTGASRPFPSFPSISHNTAESTSVTSETAPLPETPYATPKHHIPTLEMQINASSSSDDVIVAKNTSELHLLEAVSINSTAVAARAGPIAKALPRSTGSEPKNNAVRTKPKKRPKQNKKKKEKALRKVKKVKKEKKSTSHLPYFEAHYCPPQCSCYGR